MISGDTDETILVQLWAASAKVSLLVLMPTAIRIQQPYADLGLLLIFFMTALQGTRSQEVTYSDWSSATLDGSEAMAPVAPAPFKASISACILALNSSIAFFISATGSVDTFLVDLILT